MQHKYSTELMHNKMSRKKKKSRKKKLSQKEPYKIGKKKSNQREKKKSIWKDTIKKKEAELLKQEKT